MDGLEVVGDVLRVGGQVVQQVGYRPHRLNRADAGLINASPVHAARSQALPELLPPQVAVVLES